MRPLLFTILSILLAATLNGTDVSLETDSATKDYSDELPRIEPSEPDDALAAFQIVAGFTIQLVANEPLVTDPIAMAFDEYGRLFVVCMRGYSERAADNLGVVRLLEDTDDDGVYDRGTDFLTGLSWPTAIACYNGGVFVAAAPDILYCKDTDADGVSDFQRTLFTGFGKQNVQGMLNSFRWGLDNQLYGATGTNGGVVRAVSADGAQQINLRGQDFAIDPATMQIRAVSGGAQHGATFDQWGERYVCSNSDHLQWIEFHQRHLKRNPLLDKVNPRRSIAVDGPSAEVYRTSKVEPWRIVRTRLRVKAMVGGPVEGGGRAAGYFTSASGVTVYRGDALEAGFDDGNFAFVGDVGSNLVHLKRIENVGLTKHAIRATPDGREFLTSTDNWFRPVQFAGGPDGALYVVDMYREVIEHPKSLPPMIKKHLDLNSGRDRGRIYRIAPVAWKRPSRLLPGAANTDELIEMLGHANGWHRETAARLIVTAAKLSKQRSDELAIGLTAACNHSLDPIARTRALYCLSSIGRLAEPALNKMLSDQDPRVRIHALRLVEQSRRPGAATLRQLELMVNDPDLSVRYQLTLTLGALDWPHRAGPLVALAIGDSGNSKMRIAILCSMGNDRLAMLQAILSKADESTGTAKLLDEIARQIGQDRRQVATALAVLESDAGTGNQRLVARLLPAIGKKGNDLEEFLRSSGVGQLDFLERQLHRARAVVLDPTIGIETRKEALRVLCIADFDTIRPTLVELLDPRHSNELREQTVIELGKFESTAAAKLLVQSVQSLSPSARQHALESLTRRSVWATRLLDAIASGAIDRKQLRARYRQRLLRHRDGRVAERAHSLLKVESDREKLVEKMSGIIHQSGDVVRGRELFRKLCAACHRLEQIGSEVGPNLEPVRNRGAAFMLTNILDPNREVDARYESYAVLTTDGQVLAGILNGETASSVSLLQADGKTTRIERSEIDEISASGNSLMPEGLEQDLSSRELADLIAYLIHPMAEIKITNP